tara:strand:+ start:373 stop:543 length:171 start_codon:yes stop_codon:yes gene_type:complete
MSSDPFKNPVSKKILSNTKNLYPVSDKDIDTLKKSFPDNSTNTTKTKATVKKGVKV